MFEHAKQTGEQGGQGGERRELSARTCPVAREQAGGEQLAQVQAAPRAAARLQRGLVPRAQAAHLAARRAAARLLAWATRSRLSCYVCERVCVVRASCGCWHESEPTIIFLLLW